MQWAQRGCTNQIRSGRCSAVLIVSLVIEVAARKTMIWKSLGGDARCILCAAEDNRI